MCEECWALTVDAVPWCNHCVAVLKQPLSPLVPLTLSALAIGAAWLFVFTKIVPTPPALFPAELTGNWAWVVAVAATAAVGLVASRMTVRANQARQARVVAPRALDALSVAGKRHPVRGLARRVGRSLAPPMSGTLAVCLVAGVALFGATILPVVLRLPRWLEVEAVVAFFALTLAVFLSVLLYRGWRITKDDSRAPQRSRSTGWDWVDFPFEPDVEALLIILAIIIALALGWGLIEFVLPGLLFGIYLLLLAALRKVTNDAHQCERSLVRSVGWGSMWAVIYTLPIAVLVVCAQWLTNR